MSSKAPLFVLLALFAAGAAAAEQPPACPPPRPESELLAKIRRRMPSGGDQTRIVRAQRTERGCYTRVLLETTTGDRVRHLVSYISPDDRFLLTEVIDLESGRDPEAASLEKDLIQAPPAATYGPADAAVRIDVFSDFQCPYCGGAAERLKELVDTTEGVRVAFRHYPLPNHRWALVAARASVCADEAAPGTFWSLHDFYFGNQSSIKEEDVLARSREHLKGLGTVPLEKYDACMQASLGEQRVLQDLRLAAWLGITGTPTVYANGKRVGNPQTLDALRKAISSTTGVPLAPAAPAAAPAAAQ